MSKILDKMKEEMEYFEKPSRVCDKIEVMDMESHEYEYFPVSSLIPAMVLAIKDLKWSGVVSVIYNRDTTSDSCGKEIVSFRDYQLGEDGFVHKLEETSEPGGYHIYADDRARM